ncbi:MAG: lytic transglycosylase domain-containing protein [Elusimicrobiota bacterium]
MLKKIKINLNIRQRIPIALVCIILISQGYASMNLSYSERLLLSSSINIKRNIHISTGIPRKDRYDQIIIKTALKYNLNPYLLKALISVESSFNPKAVSFKGAKGLTQLMPSTAKILGVNNVFDAEENINAGARHLKFLMKKHGETRIALAYYFSGSLWKKYPGIENSYIKKIIKETENLKHQSIQYGTYKLLTYNNINTEDKL